MLHCGAHNRMPLSNPSLPPSATPPARLGRGENPWVLAAGGSGAGGDPACQPQTKALPAGEEGGCVGGISADQLRHLSSNQLSVLF